jgi:colanic acid/amylovoran biosynthesis glycosyltransferase
LNILYVTSSLPYGPGEAFILAEITELNRRGNQLWIVPMHGRGELLHTDVKDVISRCLSAKLFDRDIFFGAISGLIHSPRECIKAISLIWTSQPYHLIKNLSVVPKGIWLAHEARRLKIDHIHVHWAATTASMGLIASEISGIAWSFTAHRWDIVENNLLERKAQHAQFARFISKSGLRLAEQHGLSSDNSIVLHMGVKLSRKEITIPIERTIKRILCVANLIEVKGHRFLIDAFARLPEDSCELWLAGYGVLEPALYEQIKRLGVGNRVRFLGQLPNQELLELYRRGEVDVVVLPSLDLGGGLHEGIPVSLIEAMAHGIPVVSTLTGGIPELVSDGVGLLVPPADSVALADALGKLLQDMETRRTIGHEGNNRVQSKFSITTVIDQLEKLFRKEST